MGGISRTGRRGARCLVVGMIIDVLSAFSLVVLFATYGVGESIETRTAVFAAIASFAVGGLLLICWGSMMINRALEEARRPNH